MKPHILQVKIFLLMVEIIWDRLVTFVQQNSGLRNKRKNGDVRSAAEIYVCIAENVLTVDIKSIKKAGMRNSASLRSLPRLRLSHITTEIWLRFTPSKFSLRLNFIYPRTVIRCCLISQKSCIKLLIVTQTQRPSLVFHLTNLRLTLHLLIRR